MRLIAGLFRGRLLQCPPTPNTRPTTDRVREALFSMLTSKLYEWQGLRVLDAFAGSGAMGLEALSRGASFVHFIEQSAIAFKTLTKNVNTLDVKAQTLMEKGNFFNITSQQPFDLVFLDPPYGHAYIDQSVHVLVEKTLLNEQAWVVCEMSVKDNPIIPATYTVVTTRCFGSIKVMLLTKNNFTEKVSLL